jgi:hypothetical protein
MSETPSLLNEIKKPISHIFRRFFVKRRDATTGAFESNWQEMTQYVSRWGKYTWSVDTPRYGDLRFDNNILVVSNTRGTFNPSDNESSYWYGYGDIQRTLVKIEAGFTHFTQSSSGLWYGTEFPTNPTLWLGIISGDIYFDGGSLVQIPVRPVMQVFRDYQANQLSGFTSTGISSGGFLAILRDHTDGSGNFVFRPFIGDGTSTSWTIETNSSVLYANLNTSSAQDLHQYSVWDVVEKLANGENKFTFVNQSGSLVWQSKTIGASEIFQFHGLGSNNRVYGQTIKKINRYGKRLTGFYSRVAVKYVNIDTSTAFVNTALPYSVSGTNTAWNLGQRTFRLDNFWLPDSAAAAVVASAVFAKVSSQSEEIDFSTSFVPHVQLMDNVSITYDASEYANTRSLWDQRNWSGVADVMDLFWDPEVGDAVILQSTTFQVLSVEIDLDNAACRYIGKRT